MNRQTAVLALLLLGGCHHSSSQPTTAYPATPRTTTTAPAPTARYTPPPRVQTPAPTAYQTGSQGASQAQQGSVSGQVTPPSTYSSSSTSSTAQGAQQGASSSGWTTQGALGESATAAGAPAQGRGGEGTQSAQGTWGVQGGTSPQSGTSQGALSQGATSQGARGASAQQGATAQGAQRQGEIPQAYPTTGGAMQPPSGTQSSTRTPQAATTPSQHPATAEEMPVANLSACEGLSNEEIMHPVLGDATSTRPLTRHEGKQRATVSNGVAIRVPAQQGYNTAYVQRLLNCQAAQARASASRAAASPLAVDGTRTRVVHSRGAYEIMLTNPDPERAREIERRLESMPPATSGTPAMPPAPAPSR